jgi:hypothetical protein
LTVRRYGGGDQPEDKSDALTVHPVTVPQDSRPEQTYWFGADAEAYSARWGLVS